MTPLIVLMMILGLLVLYAVRLYNGLVSKRQRVHNAWAQIDVQLQRRHDLIPNVVATVKGYLQHERDILTCVANARQQAMAAGSDVPTRAVAENALTQSMRSLLAVAEAYPDLKANQNMLALQEELSSTENKVAFARQFYNDAVLSYNTARETFPGTVCASAGGFTPAALFVVDEPTVRALPQVQF